MGKSRNIDALTEKANAAFQQAMVKVIEKAKQTGTPVIIWEDGGIKEVPAEEMEARLKARFGESIPTPPR
jgi:hypothetical protein